ncbi:MAG: class I SAM-dependent methyltransferase [Acidimicrobiia bacterium]|nr:class I SAM-dependent methyltransferase [Acidimicrobiia bacterium]
MAGEGRAGGHWFESVADFLGPAYLRYAFTMGTDQEVGALVELLGVAPGNRVLDVGCGPGRHALALARLGFHVVGVDISATFVELAREAAEVEGLADRARFVVADARSPAAWSALGAFDAIYSLCQGAFGLAGGPGSAMPGAGGDGAPDRELDEPILAGMAGALAPGGRLVVSAFSAYFQLRFLEDRDSFDADQGVNHEHTTLRDQAGRETPAELWTSCFTPRELRLLARAVGLEVIAVHGVTPGAYRSGPPTIDCPEFLLVAHRSPPRG